MSDDLRKVGPNDDEVGLTIDGGNQREDWNTGKSEFQVTLTADRELSLSEREKLLKKLLGMEFAIEMEDDDG